MVNAYQIALQNLQQEMQERKIEGELVKEDKPFLSQRIVELLSIPTPQKVIRYREGPGKTQLAYVTHSFVTGILNKVFSGDWSFEVTVVDKFCTDKELIVKGRLTATSNGKTVFKEQFGQQTLMSGMAVGDAFKGATSDALRKCASLLGVCTDMYNPHKEGGRITGYDSLPPGLYDEPVNPDRNIEDLAKRAALIERVNQLPDVVKNKVQVGLAQFTRQLNPTSVVNFTLETLPMEYLLKLENFIDKYLLHVQADGAEDAEVVTDKQ